ncbi:MAG: hypothetical protein HY721_15810 [Planctomycetes bacterium]|nr:hypothetical protein [Planctomycetota bacterium]
MRPQPPLKPRPVPELPGILRARGPGVVWLALAGLLVSASAYLALAVLHVLNKMGIHHGAQD